MKFEKITNSISQHTHTNTKNYIKKKNVRKNNKKQIFCSNSTKIATFDRLDELFDLLVGFLSIERGHFGLVGEHARAARLSEHTLAQTPHVHFGKVVVQIVVAVVEFGRFAEQPSLVDLTIAFGEHGIFALESAHHLRRYHGHTIARLDLFPINVD